MGFSLATILVFFLVGFGFVFVNLLVGRFFRPENPYTDKLEIYECGERPIGDAWIQFNPRFYIVALIFLVFDVEIAFIFPIATVFKKFIAEGSGILAFVELFIFMAILWLALIYVWMKGDLQWIKRLVKTTPAQGS